MFSRKCNPVNSPVAKKGLQVVIYIIIVAVFIPTDIHVFVQDKL